MGFSAYALAQKSLQQFTNPYWPVELVGLEHLPRDGPVILAGNHPTVLDGGLMGLFMPRRVRFLIDAKVLRLPLLGHALRLLGSIPVERGSLSLKHARTALEKGQCLGIYPEAVPSGSLRLQRFRRGVAVLARELPEVPILPVAIQGTQPLCSHSHLYARPGNVRLQLGPALYGDPQEELEDFLQRLRRALESLLSQPFEPTFRATPATFLSAPLWAIPSALFLALSRRRFQPGPGSGMQEKKFSRTRRNP